MVQVNFLVSFPGKKLIMAKLKLNSITLREQTKFSLTGKNHRINFVEIQKKMLKEKKDMKEAKISQNGREETPQNPMIF